MRGKKQLGFTLTEIAIVLAVSMLAITWGLWARVNYVRQENAIIQGDALVTLSNSVGTYMTNNYTGLVNNTAITGVANIYAPTIAELIALGVLSDNFGANNFYGAGYGITVSRVPAACVAPNCDITSLVYLTAGIVDYRTGLVDGPTLGQAAKRIGANGGFSTRAAPATIAGVSGAWTAANPILLAGVSVPGILAVRGGYGSSGWAQFLRRDGTLPMTGGLQMGNNDITAAKDIATTTLASSAAVTVGTTLGVAGATTLGGTLGVTGATTLNSTLGVTGATTTNGITNTGAVSTSTLGTTGAATIGTTLNVAGATTLAGTLGVTGATTTTGVTNTGAFTNTGNITNTGAITATGDLTAARYLPTTVVASGAACAGLDGYQARTAAGSLASCINGQWTTPNATAVPVPCGTQTGIWSTCSASIPGPIITGVSSTVSAQSPAGATGSAVFTCYSGVQVLQPGSTCVPPPCAAQGVAWGGGCGASTGTVIDGASTTVSPSTPPGATGSATYKCTAGSLAIQPGSSCNLPPCSAASVSWSGCSGTTSSTAVGSSLTVYATSGSGSATYNCVSPGGSSGWALFSANSCTPPAIGCPAAYQSWSQYQSAWYNNPNTQGSYTCGGNVSAASSGTSQYVSNTVSGKTGSNTYTCTNGAWSSPGGACDGNVWQNTQLYTANIFGWPRNIYWQCFVDKLYTYPTQSDVNAFPTTYADCTYIDVSGERAAVQANGYNNVRSPGICGTGVDQYPGPGTLCKTPRG